MKVFLSWSGERSRQAAVILKEWLEQTIQALEPWMSPDTEKGANWSQSIGDELAATRVGIVIVTGENVASPWLNFEAGALGKTKNGRPCVFLLDVQSSDVKGPLGQFQHTRFEESDIRKLVSDLNRWVADESERSLSESALLRVLARSFPELQQRLKEIPAAEANEPQRKVPDLARETLQVVRTIRREISELRHSAVVQGRTLVSAAEFHVDLVESASADIVRATLISELGALSAHVALVGAEQQPVMLVKAPTANAARVFDWLTASPAVKAVRPIGITRVWRDPVGRRDTSDPSPQAE